jgi:hypothetical protein
MLLLLLLLTLTLLWMEYVGEAVSWKLWRRLWLMLWPCTDPGKKFTGETRPLDDAPWPLDTGGECTLDRLGLGLGLREYRWCC